MSEVVLYAGRAHTLWNTRDEAIASWRAKSLLDLVERRDGPPFWRATRVEIVECPPDVDLQQVLKRDL